LNKYFALTTNVAHAKATTLNVTTNCALRVHAFALYCNWSPQY